MSQLLRGRYRREAILRQGEAATTSLAQDTRTGSLCVVKSLQLPPARERELVDLLDREACGYAAVSDPRIPKLIESFPFEEEGRTCYVLVTEYVEGRDLARAVREDGPYAEAKALLLLRALAEPLARCHRHKPRLVHRALRPEKVIVDPAGEPHLVDFGSWSRAMRRLLGPEAARSADDGRGYAAPEQLAGDAVPASDVYALGATVAFALTGRDPAERGAARLPASRKLRRVLGGMQAQWLEERYADAGAVLRALDEPTLVEGLLDRRVGIAAAATLAFAVLLLTRRPPPPAPPAARVSERTPSSMPTAKPESPPPVRRSPPARASERLQQVTEGRQPRERTLVSATPAPEPRPTLDLAPPPVWPRDGLLSIDVYRDFKYVAAGWPGGLGPGQTNTTPLDTRPQERLYAEPRYASSNVFYGSLRLGNGRDPLVTFVLDELERPTWVVWVDKNNNQDLTDDGPPLAHQGSGLHLAANVSLEVEVQSRGSRPERRPYKIWLWVNELEGAPAGPSRYAPRFYAVCHYAGRVELFGETFDAVAFEERGHDALFGEDGIWIDLDRNGKFERPGEHFVDGEEVRTGRGWWRLRIGHP